ncbi:MAG: hypothetical protein NTZ26_02530, partial [Candidatus Aminicenantes bacterium]|nr:hypothetical protein [Candidatus Aminicenantes bacterium]
MNSIVGSKFLRRTSAFIIVLLWSVVYSFSLPDNDKAGKRFVLEGNTPAFSSLSAAIRSAAQPHWQSLGPGCLSVSQIIVDPQRPSVVYAITQQGRVYKSSDGGANWQLAGEGLPAQPESEAALAIDPQRPSFLYLGLSSGVYRSTDGAATWTKLPPGPSGISILVASPADSLTLYAGCSEGALKSADGGKTWTGLGIAIHGVRTIAFDPQNPAVIYIGGYPASYPSVGAALWKSVDGGANWTGADAGIFLGSYQFVSSIAVDPKSSSIVYAGTYQGLYKSTDGGLSWICLYETEGQEKIVIDPQEPNTLYLAVDSIYVSQISPILLKSRDGGRSWALIMKGLEGASGFYDIALSGQEPNILWIGRAPLGISKTYDGGTTWYPSSAGLPSSGPVISLVLPPLAAAPIYVGTGVVFPLAGVFRSMTGGASWQIKNDGLNLFTLPVSSRNLVFLSGDPSSPAKLYAYVNEFVLKLPLTTTLYQSSDGGDHWSGLSSNGAYKYGLAVDPKNPSVLYAPSSQGVAKSSDGGSTWTDLNVPPASVLVIHPQTPALLFAGTKSAGVYVSTDAGANWTAVNSGLADLNILALALAENSPAVLYAGTASGMFQSSDEGAHWTAINNGLSNLVVKVIAVDPRFHSTIYAGTDGGGVFRSVDGGVNWTAFNAGLDNLTINCLGVDPSDSSRVYAGTNTGLFSTYDPPSISLSRNRMTFGAIAGGSGPRPQTVQIKNQGSGALQWTASATASWIQLLPGAGSGNGLLQVGVNPAALIAGKYAGLIQVSDPAADNSPQLIDIELNAYAQGTTAPPFGYFDTPLDGTTGISGSIPVTGWALDDIEVTGVKIYRDPVGAEPAGSCIYIGDAVFVEGSRSDVEV